MTTVAHCRYMALRHLRALARQPWYVAFTLVQPIIWLLLFSELFKRVVELPGFDSGSYIAFLTPGIVVMTALQSSGWNGMSMIEDLDRGVLDRFLVSPASRLALIAGRIIQLALVAAIQSLIVIGLAFVRGARFDGGPLGVAVLIAVSVLLAAPFGALSNGLALLVRKEESIIGAVTLVMLPLTFVSTVFMAKGLMPAWMRHVAAFNPVDWAVRAGREALGAHVEWSLVATRSGWLLALAVVCGWFATRAFRTYQRSA
ncbi:MAG TPA: ABC transporter permease [Actinomycetes bacterium]